VSRGRGGSCPRLSGQAAAPRTAEHRESERQHGGSRDQNLIAMGAGIAPQAAGRDRWKRQRDPAGLKLHVDDPDILDHRGDGRGGSWHWLGSRHRSRQRSHRPARRRRQLRNRGLSCRRCPLHRYLGRKPPGAGLDVDYFGRGRRSFGFDQRLEPVGRKPDRRGGLGGRRNGWSGRLVVGLALVGAVGKWLEHLSNERSSSRFLLSVFHPSEFRPLGQPRQSRRRGSNRLSWQPRAARSAFALGTPWAARGTAVVPSRAWR
jgi:hypothetical protein